MDDEKEETMFYYLSKLETVRALDSHALIYREGNGTPLQYSCLENPMDRGA